MRVIATMIDPECIAKLGRELRLPLARGASDRIATDNSRQGRFGEPAICVNSAAGVKSMATANGKSGVSATHRAFSKIANGMARVTGRPGVFMMALLAVLVWAMAGPLYRYSDTWRLVINTGTTIVTFLMVFLIQNSQNRNSAAIQVKLDELIRVSAGQNVFVGIERLTDSEIERLREIIERRAKGTPGGRAIEARARAAADNSDPTA
jgi:low affinity Fe/Cu permease